VDQHLYPNSPSLTEFNRNNPDRPRQPKRFRHLDAGRRAGGRLGFIMAMLDVIPNLGLSVRVVFTVFALCMMTAVALVQRGINPDL
jgi:hypothetical protein